MTKTTIREFVCTQHGAENMSFYVEEVVNFNAYMIKCPLCGRAASEVHKE